MDYLWTASVCGTSGLSGTGNRNFNCIGKLDNSSTEERFQLIIRSNTTVSNMGCYVSANTNDGNADLVSRVNAANGNMAIVIAAGLTGWFWDVVNSDNLSPGDAFNFKGIGNGTLGSMTFETMECQATSAVLRAQGAAVLAFGSTGYATIGGYLGTLLAPEADVEYTMRDGATLSNLAAYLYANTIADGTTVFRCRVPAGDGNQVVTFLASTTGTQEDVTHSDVLASGDTVSTSVTTGGSVGNCSIGYVSYKTVPDAGMQLIAGKPTGQALDDADAMRYYGLCSSLESSVETEDQTQSTLKFACKFAHLGVMVTGNDNPNNGTFRLRKNGADTILVATVIGMTTGLFEDLVNEVSGVVDDVVNYGKITPESVGDTWVTVTWIGVEQRQPGGGGGHPAMGNLPGRLVAAGCI